MEKTNLAFSKKDDLTSEFYYEWGTNLESLLGEWTNVNPKTGQISRIIMSSEDDETYIQCFGQLEDGEQDWGQTPCQLFSDNVSSPVIEGFVGSYDLDFIEIMIVGNIKYGVMVVQSYNTFKDGSKRNNYIAREFFCKIEDK